MSNSPGRNDAVQDYCPPRFLAYPLPVIDDNIQVPLKPYLRIFTFSQLMQCQTSLVEHMASISTTTCIVHSTNFAKPNTRTLHHLQEDWIWCCRREEEPRCLPWHIF